MERSSLKKLMDYAQNLKDENSFSFGKFFDKAEKLLKEEKVASDKECFLVETLNFLREWNEMAIEDNLLEKRFLDLAIKGQDLFGKNFDKNI